ncbi:hypothetical protein ACSSS7_005364 [Eimeria intestinalis]
MALTLVKENILIRLRRCRATDNQFFLNLLQGLQEEQASCISFVNQANLFLHAQMITTQSSPGFPFTLQIPQTIIFISDMFKDFRTARSLLVGVQQKHAELLRQYGELEAALDSVNTECFPLGLRVTPAMLAALDALSHLEIVVKSKEQDLQQNDRRRRTEQMNEDTFFPRLLFQSPSELHRDEPLAAELMLALPGD